VGRLSDIFAIAVNELLILIIRYPSGRLVKDGYRNEVPCWRPESYTLEIKKDGCSVIGGNHVSGMSIAVNDAELLRLNAGGGLSLDYLQVFGQPGALLFVEIVRMLDLISYAKKWHKAREVDFTWWWKAVELAQQGTDIAKRAAPVRRQFVPECNCLIIDQYRLSYIRQWLHGGQVLLL
jgi:hypothetical protein